VSLAGFYFKITASEWLFQTLAIGLVMSVEGINTAVEKISILFILITMKNWFH
jgi:diacylglycerol kinase (ATP)